MKTPIPYVKNYKLKAGNDFSQVLTFGQSISSWVFTGKAVAADGSSETDLTFTKASPSVTVSIAKSITADYTAQDYKYYINIERSSIEKTYIEGVITVTLLPSS